MTTLDWKRVHAAVRLFNRNPRWAWEDYLVHEVRWGWADENRLPGLAFSVNAAWNAGVRMESLGLLVRQIRQQTPELVAESAILRRVDLLEADPVLVGSVCERLLRLILTGAGERKAVFAMKFIHWCVPCVLPPLDGEAWKAINDLTCDGQPWPGDGVWTPDTCVAFWRRALAFYVDALSMSQLPNQPARELIEFDLASQREGYRCGNTLVRILDKYLWLEGKSLSARRARKAAAQAPGRP